MASKRIITSRLKVINKYNSANLNMFCKMELFCNVSLAYNMSKLAQNYRIFIN